VDLPSVSFDPAMLELMARVCDEAWLEIQTRSYLPQEETEMRQQIARRVMSAGVEGERNPERLKYWALHSMAD